MSAWLDNAAAGEDGYTGGVQYTLPGDVRDQAQMGQFMPDVAKAQGMSWWESLAAYGVTRAIDNRFAPPNVLGNVYPGTFGGQNGATYQAGRPGMPMMPGQPALAVGQGGLQMSSGTLLLLGAGVVFLLMNQGK